MSPIAAFLLGLAAGVVVLAPWIRALRAELRAERWWSAYFATYRDRHARLLERLAGVTSDEEPP